jgi:sugar/nucleoside kinase (ribokinase family)
VPQAEPPEIVGLGYCCLDELVLLSEIPEPEGRALVRERATQGGGMVATAMVATAKLGARVGFIGKVGDDETGDAIAHEFRAYGVDVSRLVVAPGVTSHRTIVLVDERNGARSFLSVRGTAGPVEADELDRAYVTGARYLHLSDASDAALRAARWAREAGKEVCLDGTHFLPSLWPLLPLVDYLIVSRFFASEFAAHAQGRGEGRAAALFAGEPGGSGSHPAEAHPADEKTTMLAGEALLEVAAQLRGHGPRVVVVTEGEHGSWCASEGGTFRVPAFPVPHMVDTTGAGDVYHGAFLFARARGSDLKEALSLASATAALKCRALGGRAGIPTIEEVRTLIESEGIRT